MPQTILYGALETELGGAAADRDQLWIPLGDPALTGQLAATPEFWQAVQALGERYYYPPTEMAGMPEPLPPR
jgi:hypothetical protein